MNSALFLDRDGTLIRHIPYLCDAAKVELLPGVSEALTRVKTAGHRFFLFTNQSGVGRGLFSLEDVEACNRRMLELIGLGPQLFTEICVAPEAPGQASRYRKPSPNFVLEMISRYSLSPQACWMIGDNETDWRAGLNAGIRSIAVRSDLTTTQTEAERVQLCVPLCENLAAACAYIALAEVDVSGRC